MALYAPPDSARTSEGGFINLGGTRGYWSCGGGAKEFRLSDSLPEIRTGPEIPAKPGCKGSRFRRPLQFRQKFAPERSYGTEWIGAHLEHAGAYARVEFLRRWRSSPVPSCRHAGVRLCEGA